MARRAWDWSLASQETSCFKTHDLEQVQTKNVESNFLATCVKYGLRPDKSADDQLNAWVGFGWLVRKKLPEKTIRVMRMTMADKYPESASYNYVESTKEEFMSKGSNLEKGLRHRTSMEDLSQTEQDEMLEHWQVSNKSNFFCYKMVDG